MHLTSAAGLIALGFEPVLATQVINILGAVLLVGAVVVGANMAAPGQENALPRAVAITAALAAEGMAAWILGGLEAVLAAGLVGAAIACLVPLFRSGWPERIDLPALAGLFFAMAYLTRPDSVVMNAAAGFAVLGLGAAALRTRIRQFLVIGIIPFTVLVLHMAWRLDYYGDYLPNTFFAKVGVDVGTRLAMVPFYFAKSFAGALPVVPLAFGFLAFALYRRRVDALMLFLAAVILAHVAYVAWSGGDHMPMGRVLLGTLAPACILLAACLAQLPQVMRLPVAAMVVLALLGSTLLTPKTRKLDPAAYVGSIVGRYIAETWPPGSLVALHTAGSTPYFAPDNVYIDMLGLNDRPIAKRENFPVVTEWQMQPGHSKGDGVYVLSRKPDYIIMGTAEGRELGDPIFLSDYEMAELSEMTECYEPVFVEIDYQYDPAETVPWILNPLPFRYYRRTCPS
ncbi:MAG: hypothetical protein AAF074_04215 [Pseudomonadota bacterium]